MNPRGVKNSGNIGMVQLRVAASSAAPRLSLPKAWGWQSSKSGATIPPLGEDATPYGATDNVTRNLTYLNHARILAPMPKVQGGHRARLQTRRVVLRDAASHEAHAPAAPVSGFAGAKSSSSGNSWIRLRHRRDWLPDQPGATGDTLVRRRVGVKGHHGFLARIREFIASSR